MAGIGGVRAFSRRRLRGGRAARDGRAPAPPRARRVRGLGRPRRRPGPHPAGDHRRRALAPADALGRRPLGARLQRRDLQPREPAGPPGLPVPHPRRHRGRRGRARAGGHQLRRAAAGPVRPRRPRPAHRHHAPGARPPRASCRSTTATSPAASPSARRSRRCWPSARPRRWTTAAWTPTWAPARCRHPTPSSRA